MGAVARALQDILYDPQTSGGLLCAVPAAEAEACLAELRAVAPSTRKMCIRDRRIASFSNMLGGGVLVQRFGDLVKGRRTNEKRMLKSFTKPTLSATPGDLSLVLPKRHLDDIIEMIYALDKIAPGMANADTLLYGVEVKFYSARLELDSNLETKVANMFAVGDGAGITRGLSQALSLIHI